MNFCQNCGNNLEGSKKFCPSCGSLVVSNPQVTPAYSNPSGNSEQSNHSSYPGQSTQSSYSSNYNHSNNSSYSNNPNYSNNPQNINQANDDEFNDKLMAVLAYIIFFIPLIVGAHKKSDFVKFHTNQGTVLVIIHVIWGIIDLVVLVPSLYYNFSFFSILLPVFNLAGLAFWICNIFGIVCAVTNVMRPIPIIDKIKIIK